MMMDVKEGKWIYEEDPNAFIYFRERWVCSICGRFETKSHGRTKFCPHCGALLMKESDDEEVQITES